MSNPRVAVYAGSFDPPTIGHIWMIKQGVALFDKLVVAVGTNPDKHYMFTVNERLNMLKRSVDNLPGIEFGKFEKMFLIDYADSVDAKFILRGIRNEDDYKYELIMRKVNADLNPKISTVFIMSPIEIAEVSSSMVKGIVGIHKWEDVIRRYVTMPVFESLKERYEKHEAKME